jgi:hypothetical protein
MGLVEEANINAVLTRNFQFQLPPANTVRFPAGKPQGFTRDSPRPRRRAQPRKGWRFWARLTGEGTMLGGMMPWRADSMSTVRRPRLEECREGRWSPQVVAECGWGRRQRAWAGVADKLPPAPLDDRIWVGLLPGQPAPLSAHPRQMDWGRVLSWPETSRRGHLAPRGSRPGPVSLVLEKVQLGQIWVPAGAWRRHPSGHAPLAGALQRQPLPPTTYCNHDSWQCGFPAAAAFKLLLWYSTLPWQVRFSTSHAPGSVAAVTLRVPKALTAFALQLPFWSYVNLHLNSQAA